MKLLTEKYNPKNLDEFNANKLSLDKLKNFISKKSKKKAALLYGVAGSGKTSSVYVLANSLGYEVLEVNASDFRNREQIENIVEQATKQKSLFHKGKIILVDEVDGLAGREDYGGVQALARVIDESKQPIVLIANGPYIDKLSSIRKKCEMIEFGKVDYNDIIKVLKNITKKEKLNINEDFLKIIAKSADGDLRAAINDLQSFYDSKDLEALASREKTEKIINVLRVIFKSKNYNEVINILEKTDLDLDECLLWLDENLPYEYKNEDLIKAYELLSRADVFRGRIIRWQHWRFLAYMNDLMGAGVAIIKNSENKSFANYKRSSRILKMWIYKNKNAKRKAIAEKLARYTHISSKKAFQELPYLLFLKDKDIMSKLNLDEEEIDWLKR